MMRKIVTLLIAASIVVLTACSDSDESAAVNMHQDDDNTTATVDDNYVYTLPVIFHVLYQDADDKNQYVSYDRLVEMLNNVNDIYKGGVYGASSDIGVKFVLALYDENGERLRKPGAEYVKYEGTYPIDEKTLMSDSKGTYTKYIWEPNNYINVLVYPFKGSGSTSATLGISHMPYAVKGDDALEGLETVNSLSLSKRNLKFAYCVSINSKYIYSESSRYTTDKGSASYTYTNTDSNVTLAHEFGHYLGLMHVFTENYVDGDYVLADECRDTDCCDDTPTYNRSEYSEYVKTVMGDMKSGSGTQKLFMRNDCDNGTFLSENIMDYDFSFSFSLTAQQRERIRTVLYYSPLMPGPRRDKDGASTTRTEVQGMVDLPIRMAY